MGQEQLLHKDITYDIRGACFWVWKEFGGGFKEKIIDRALTIELKRRGRRVEDQKRIDIQYQGIKVGTYVPDKIVDDAVLVELKCKEFLTAGDVDQFWKYLKGSKYKVGLLINFGPKGLEIKRLVYDTSRVAYGPRPDPRSLSASRSAEKGFTLMEIMVATVVFAVVVVALLTLFNYVLKINRRGEALRQAAQDSRDFVELLVKEIRNGQIDYYISNGLTYNSSYINNDSSVPCQPPGGLGAPVTGQPTYQSKSNWLGIINTDNVEECFYFAHADGATYAGSGVFSAPSGGNYSLVLEKSGITVGQKLNPPNSRIDSLTFFVRPQNDPYSSAGSGLPKIQPVVGFIIKFVVQLSTGEQVPIYYQTAVSENKYDIPNH